ncbi:nucleotide sugar dehydrogenase [Alkalihalophilus pseudofirmus]|uniref:nucleotide sugar dehydrogenase n=1 Tax=Alkalihalophilus pseudofirmus TaxID=79885 RepID=UPI00259B184F|nr:nucleotide sugar dehydrogenase [Alkalihalophilus pseudofirmus]WEG15360.1 nucleotide sugar dehydrogenase [Alkalihalophilus pseudofirmus]
MSDVESNIESREDKIGIVGLGYVGLPLALLFSDKKYTVYGIDKDINKINSLLANKSYLNEISDEEILTSFANNSRLVSNEYDVVKDLDVIIICVPTPLTKENEPDLTYLRNAAHSLVPHLQKNQLIILESSTYPGTTREELKPIIEKSGLKVGIDIFLAYSSERIDPGNIHFKLEDIPKVISGVTDTCLQKVEDLYSSVFKETVKVTSPEIAEMSKVVENSYRFINISFINEVSQICEKLNINVWEVIEAARTKPFGFSPFFPGPGIGGHCIPIDPMYLQWKANQVGHESKFIELANQINDEIPSHIINKLKEAMNGSLENKNILIYGVAYKKDVNDVRSSPALPIIKALLNNKALVSYHDPFIDSFSIEGTVLKNSPLTNSVLNESDCVLILTDHSKIPIEQIIDQAKLIYDTKNILGEYKEGGNIIQLGDGINK